ncbi:ECF transporter S component [Gracilinema caldarium]|uniref:ECF transporter S component n=1 Tax=Gracilinema caldarium TaxID=215591 RepID=UPI0026EAF3C0|nr:ECF transporter S component [Gracilinema caldarium]
MAVLPVRKIAVAGVLSAISIVLGVTRLGFIPWFSGASVTILQVPVIVGAVLEGPLVGFVIGLLFGLSSLLQAAIAPTGPVDVAFTNPFISVVPRLLIGPVSWLLYRLIAGSHSSTASAGLDKPKIHPVRYSASLIAAGLGGSLTNTILVLSALGIFGFFPWSLIFTVAIGNGPVEAAVSAVITLIVVSVYTGIGNSLGKAKLSKLEE